jgi:CheY-like chemotaxis protein
MGCKILIVEDDVELRSMMDVMLSNDGFEPITASNGYEALQVLQKGASPHVIVLDLMMPVMDGWQFRKALRQHPGFWRIPTVVVSALTNPNVSDLQAAAVLPKPVNVDELVRVIHAHC